MLSALAGFVDHSPHPTAAARGALERALGGAGGYAAHGPLTLAWRPAGDAARSADLLCRVDGRVANLDELRRELGARAGSSPDTVVLAAYRRWGEQMLARLRGEWIVVVGDRAAGTTLFARDQLGARQLCLHGASGRIAFASEIHQLLRLLPRRPQPDDDVLAHWLAHSDPPAGRTPYAGIRRLRAAHFLRLGPDGVVERRYWAPRRGPRLQHPREDLAHRLVVELTRAVNERCGPGERTGVLLSGGLDSGTIAALGRRRTGADAPGRAYCAVFPKHAAMDETRFIDAITASLALPSTRIRMAGGSMLAGALAYLDAWELPLVSPNLALWRPLFERAALQGTTVMLDGEGGDTILGVARYLIADRLQAGQPLQALALVRHLPGAGDNRSRRLLLALVRDLGLKAALPADVRRIARRLLAVARPDPPWLRPLQRRALRDNDRSLDWQSAPRPRWSAHLATELTDGLDAAGIQDHLRRRAAMAGLEASHPFLDCDLLELVLSLPPELSFDAYRDRPLLRDGLAGLLPDAVRVRRDKTRFSALLIQTLTRDDLPTIRRLLEDPRAEVGAYVDRERVRHDLLNADPARFQGGSVAWCYAVWRLVTAECWLRFQEDRELPGRLLRTSGLRPADYELVDVPA